MPVAASNRLMTPFPGGVSEGFAVRSQATDMSSPSFAKFNRSRICSR